MKVTGLCAAAAIAAIFACDGTRQHECSRVLATLQPLAGQAPNADAVARMRATLVAMSLQDQPLREYVLSTKATLQTLENSMKMQASPSPPDGTDDLVATKLKEARGERDDITRYCAE